MTIAFTKITLHLVKGLFSVTDLYHSGYIQQPQTFLDDGIEHKWTPHKKKRLQDVAVSNSCENNV